MKNKVWLVFLIVPLFASAQRQYADTLYSPPLDAPQYHKGEGPIIYVDEGHHNFHTINGRYRPMADLLRRDGYNIKNYTERFQEDKLKELDILIIANAMNEINVGQWYKPIYPAFTDKEVEILHKWVENGGKLFLIADHMPMAGGMANLAKAFGYGFNDGFATDSTRTGPDLFTLSNKQLIKNELTQYRRRQLDSIMTFTGQAFTIPGNSEPILKCGKTWVSYQPDVAWKIDENTPKIMADTLYQGAYQNYGKGRLVVFGEAAMFSAQIAEVNDKKFKAGMNRRGAENNYKLLLSIIHWLDPRTKK